MSLEHDNIRKYPERFDPHFGASKALFEYARNLRKQSTPAEKHLWEELRNNKLGGLKFRRQHPIDRFIADFYCHSKRLVVEIDGSIHHDREIMDYDIGRTDELMDFGITVIRFSNKEVLTARDEVLRQIDAVAAGLPEFGVYSRK